ncbi:protein YgfX [Pseudomonas abieticivorans]|uniref:protein YgfX n=1 Tax=Pseudomonas abieticivorans TaxID=2931382 RepID=UPI0020C16D2D|nr:protein YgfX [Pseudomonas sp. PIA16]
MSSPSDRFECRWRASGRLLAAYLAAQGLALIALLLLDIPFLLTFAGVLLCLAHGAWVLPRQVLLSHPHAYTRLRRSPDGWALWCARDGWQPVQLLPDSLALPGLVVLRFRRKGRWWGQGLCIPADALAPDQHRRLRLRLKFSRRRWAASE